MRFSSRTNYLLLGLLCLIGAVILIETLYINPGRAMPLEPGIFSEKINIPLKFLNLGLWQLPLEVENFVLFQNYESLPPILQTNSTLVFGLAIWLLTAAGMVFVSTFKRVQFIVTAVIFIGLSLLAGFNGLNIGGINTPYGLLIWILGMVAPAMLIHTFLDHWQLGKRALVIIPVGLLTLPLLAYLSPVINPYLMMAENLSLLAMGFSFIFFAYIGHSAITGLFFLLVKLNKGVGIKVTWHFVTIFIIYLIALIFVYLDITGNATFGFPIVPIPFLFLLVGALGFLEVHLKTKQIEQPYPFPSIGKNFYLIGFAIAIFTYWKAAFSVNQPMHDFLRHGFIYTQIAFSTLFFAYVLANFSNLMNSGQMVHRVLFEPKLFAYIHMRLGALIGMLSLVMFADGVIGLQFGASSTNLAADYYYATNRPLEAGILFENSWDRYRNNPKAKNASAHMKLNQRQPTLAKRELEQSLEVAPTVNDIILLSSVLHRENKVLDAIFYLTKGLEIFPDNIHLSNNLALLQSRINKSEDAYALLENLSANNKIILANKIGLQVKHLIRFEEEMDPENDLIAQINSLAFHNQKGNIAPFSLRDEKEVNTPLLERALLTNQWSNQTTGTVGDDLAFIDQKLSEENAPQAEEEWRQLRVLRTLQANRINEAVEYSNGLAFGFAGSAGYYHHLTAMILAGQLDFEKAAKELQQAEEKGFRNFKPEHLAILYYGGKPDLAMRIALQYEADWPEWLNLEEETAVETQEERFFHALSRLLPATKQEVLDRIATVDDVDMRSRLAYETLWRKAHWFDTKELEGLKTLILQSPTFQQEESYISELITMLKPGEWKIPSQERLERTVDGSDLTANAYWTPLVLKAVEAEEDLMEKYNILQEAISFNRDPLLWINFVKHSRMAGLHQYGSEALSDMRGWVDDQTLEELQVKHF
ncbi:hypothetical protein KI659_02335 [Litoribacter alkaliphilus]|uniref:Tetratricopeptide repeat protein n=1 Tax=Litoribacter ruber TaxID=702568 RepID=A0AAP2G0H6_9BACT|nr:hypothetical protein [Litoribacter alkaliphilus]MBS9522844.1 hypothetical protein [Litoribacter alkaliphilus]